MVKLLFIWCFACIPWIIQAQLSVSKGTMVRLQYGVKPLEMAGKIQSITRITDARLKPKLNSPLTFRSKYQHIYDSHGLQLESKTWSKNGIVLKHSLLHYNLANTQLVNIEYLTNNTKFSGDYTPYTEIWESDSICWYIDTTRNWVGQKNEYSRKGIIQKMTQYNGDTSDVSRTDLYDKLGNRIHREETLDGKMYTDSWSYTYDQKGNISRCKGQYDSRYTYDDLNRKLTYSLKSSYGVELISYGYNIQGDIILQIRKSYNPKRNYTSITEYKYDNRGNWISKIVFIDDVDITHENRVIEYFD